jgi:hypothetical protein
LIVRGDHASAMELIDRNPALAAGFFLSEIATPCSKGSRRVTHLRRAMGLKAADCEGRFFSTEGFDC